MIYTKAEQIDFSLGSLPPMATPGRIHMADPEFYQVEYVINPHMQQHVGSVDRSRAIRQWTELKKTYEALGFRVEVIPATSGFPDFVFCANQSLPFQAEGSSRGVVLGSMFATQRRGEVRLIADYFRQEGSEVRQMNLDEGGTFEGTGDALWHPGRRLLWGGYGFRTTFQAYERLSELLDCPIVLLKLTDPDFYHLDTCLSPLDEHTVLTTEAAFDATGLRLLRRLFDRLVFAPEAEARELFACNAHCPDARHVIIQRGCTETVRSLHSAGYEPIELDTSEFLKAGGSVFCMKLASW